MLHTLYEHPLLLPAYQIAQGTTALGDEQRMYNFCQKLMSGRHMQLLTMTWHYSNKHAIAQTLISHIDICLVVHHLRIIV